MKFYNFWSLWNSLICGFIVFFKFDNFYLICLQMFFFCCSSFLLIQLHLMVTTSYFPCLLNVCSVISRTLHILILLFFIFYFIEHVFLPRYHIYHVQKSILVISYYVHVLWNSRQEDMLDAADEK